MNRFKINIAKEKILKLREKYSKNTNNEDLNSSSESLISSRKENSIQKKNSSFKQETEVTDNPDLLNTPSTVNVKCDPFREIINDNTAHERKLKNQELLEKKHSSENLVLLDQSNEFERICFISSSSEELSDIESESIENKSLSEKVATSVAASEHDKTSSIGDIELVKFAENLPKQNTLESISSSSELQSSSKQTNTSKISSIKELIHYELEFENTPIISPYLDEAKHLNSVGSAKKFDLKSCHSLSNEASVENNSIRSFTSISENVSSSEGKNVLGSREKSPRTYSNEKPESGERPEINCIKKQTHSRNKKDSSAPRLQLSGISHKALLIHEGANGDHNRSNGYDNKSTNTDPVKVTLLKNVTRQYPSAHKTCTEKPKHSVRRKKRDIYLKASIQRPFIKPCILINKNEIKKFESQISLDQEFQHALKQSLIGDVFYYSSLNANNGLSCNDLVSHMLRSQIQLTKHFMESHQRMYMQVCQAAQMLNENYSPTC